MTSLFRGAKPPPVDIGGQQDTARRREVDGGDSPIGGESEPLYQQLQQQQLGRLASPALSTSSQEHNDDALLTLKSPGPLETGNVDPLASALLQRTGTPPSDEASKKAKKPLLFRLLSQQSSSSSSTTPTTTTATNDTPSVIEPAVSTPSTESAPAGNKSKDSIKWKDRLKMKASTTWRKDASGVQGQQQQQQPQQTLLPVLVLTADQIDEHVDRASIDSSTSPSTSSIADKFDEKDHSSSAIMLAPAPSRIRSNSTMSASSDISGPSAPHPKSPAASNVQESHHSGDKDDDTHSHVSGDSGGVWKGGKQKGSGMSDTDRSQEDAKLAVYRLAYEQYKLSSDELADVHSSLEPIVSKMPSAMAKLDQKHSKSNKRITAAAATIDAELEELKAAIATMDTDMTRVSKELNTIQDRFEDYGVTISRNSDMIHRAEDDIRVIQSRRDANMWGEMFWLIVSWLLAFVALAIWLVIYILRIIRRFVTGRSLNETSATTASLFGTNAEQLRERWYTSLKGSVSRRTGNSFSLDSKPGSVHSKSPTFRRTTPALHEHNENIGMQATTSGPAMEDGGGVLASTPRTHGIAHSDGASSVGPWSLDDELFGTNGSQSSDQQSMPTYKRRGRGSTHSANASTTDLDLEEEESEFFLASSD